MDMPAFKEAMSRYPSGVVVATTQDSAGRLWGFTASSFSSVSLDPPLVLVCLAKTAECFATFSGSQRLAINILGAGDEATAARFARRGVDKFAGVELEFDAHGTPMLASALARLSCEKFEAYDCGDHSVIVGRVTAIRLGSEDDPMVYLGRRFGRFASAAPPQAVQGRAAAEPIRHCARCGSAVAIQVPEGDWIDR